MLYARCACNFLPPINYHTILLTSITSRTAEQIRRIRQQLEEEKDSRLAQLRADTDATFSSLDAHYEQQHSQLSRELFEKILTM